MTTPLRLIIEEPTFMLESTLIEKKDSQASSLYINGPYMMAERKNRNGRVYPMEEMEREVGRYLNEMVKTKRSIGELNHPASAEINPERACHMVTEMKRDGDFFHGKSKILNTPLGTLVRNMILDDVQLGVSSRALGKLSEATGGTNTVSEMHLVCMDVVADPSVDIAFVDGILESKAWILNNNGNLEESFDKFENGIATIPIHESREYLKNLALDFIDLLGNA